MTTAEHSAATESDLRQVTPASLAGGPQSPAPIGPDDHHLGGLDAPLQLLEYGDYECPYCALAQPGVADLVRRYGDHLVFAFRHFPLVSQHPHAWRAALAAEAAGRQGKFWEAHDHLLAHQELLAPDDLLAHARELGLDRDAFRRDLADEKLAERVRRDALEGAHSGVRGTPTFFVNGRRLEGGYREAEIEAALDQALASR